MTIFKSQYRILKSGQYFNNESYAYLELDYAFFIGTRFKFPAYYQGFL